MRLRLAELGLLFCALAPTRASAGESPSFARHVTPLFSRLGCNGGTCHGAVQGQNGFRLTLFGAGPQRDYQELLRGAAGRRVDLLEPRQSLLLLKATGHVPHGGGQRMRSGSPEYQIFYDWIAAGAACDAPSEGSNENALVELRVDPPQHTAVPGQQYRLRVEAHFAAGSVEDVTGLCTFTSRSPEVATVDADGHVTAVGPGDTAMLVRYGAEPVMSMIVVSRPGSEAFPKVTPFNFVDEHILAKLRRLNIPPADLADDATFLRRVRLDVTGQLPTPEEILQFVADADPNKRARKIDQLLGEPGHAALWTLKFCDLLRASDFGVYADALEQQFEAPRFQAWVRARLEENLPYDQFAERILTATSREGRSLEEWAEEVIALQAGYTTPRTDLEVYSRRRTLDAYWQRKATGGVTGAMQVAHAFLGLRLECAQCHRHPHDVWQQDDLLSFANFFMRVRTVGFQGGNEKKYPEQAALAKQFAEQGKKLAEEAKQLKEGKAKELADKARASKSEADRLRGEIEAVQQEIRQLERRARVLQEEAPKRILHAEILHRTDPEAAQAFASVTSPLGSQSSKEFRLLGEPQPVEIADGEDPRRHVAKWLARADNPFFAKALVNRVWAHYFGRGIIDPPDDLSPLNPPTHPELLEALCRGFIEHGYDLKWLHRTILVSRTYQQSSRSVPEHGFDRANYACFALRRLPAEVLLDALDAATGTSENLDMKYYHWPELLRTVELPYLPRNTFVAFMLEQFGRPARNSSVQCDCERQSEASMLQVLSLLNHPRVRQKIADPAGRVAQIVKSTSEDAQRIEALYLNTVSRLPEAAESEACLHYLREAPNPEAGLQGVMWSLLNTREFLLQH
jgi:hypothetical protein